ncbi:hypothetical protein DV515_00001892, partial [Chloebia gouldiae]
GCPNCPYFPSHRSGWVKAHPGPANTQAQGKHPRDTQCFALGEVTSLPKLSFLPLLEAPGLRDPVKAPQSSGMHSAEGQVASSLAASFIAICFGTQPGMRECLSQARCCCPSARRGPGSQARLSPRPRLTMIQELKEDWDTTDKCGGSSSSRTVQ